MNGFLYSFGLLGLAAAFSFSTGPLRILIASVFLLHLLSGLVRAARLKRWWSLAHIFGYYLFVALLFPKVFLLLQGTDVGAVWNMALGAVCMANIVLWLVAWTQGVKVDKGYPTRAALPEYLSFSWLERAEA